MEYAVRRPTPAEETKASIIYNKVFREALEDGVMLRNQLNDFLEKNGFWSKEKTQEYEKFIKDINEKQNTLSRGNMPLKAAKNLALEIKRLRLQFRSLIAERTSHDSKTAEGVADDAKFNYYISVCVIDPTTKKQLFKNLDDYNSRATEDWVLKAASDLAALMYGLDPQYEDGLPENKFLTDYKFVNKDGKFVNKDGHPIEIDADGKERLVNNDGEYVAYDENGNQYKVDEDGNKIEEFKPFLDDDGNPILLEEKKEEPAE